MFAIIKTGGKQYKVKKGSVLEVELLEGSLNSEVEFQEVLLVAEDSGELKIGKPYLAGAKVTADIFGESKGEKILVFKKKRRKDYRKRIGHSQKYTKVKIKDIVIG